MIVSGLTGQRFCAAADAVDVLYCLVCTDMFKYSLYRYKSTIYRYIVSCLNPATVGK